MMFRIETMGVKLWRMGMVLGATANLITNGTLKEQSIKLNFKKYFLCAVC